MLRKEEIEKLSRRTGVRPDSLDTWTGKRPVWNLVRRRWCCLLALLIAVETALIAEGKKRDSLPQSYTDVRIGVWSDLVSASVLLSRFCNQLTRNMRQRHTHTWSHDSNIRSCACTFVFLVVPCAKVGILPDLPTRPRISIIMAGKTWWMVLPPYW